LANSSLKLALIPFGFPNITYMDCS
jgi:hypothetical protein